MAAKDLLKEKDLLIKRRLKAAETNGEQSSHHIRTSERIPLALFTTLAEEATRMQERYERVSQNSGSNSSTPWLSLGPHQQLCFTLVVKHTLNDEQTRAFLLLADKIWRELESGRKEPPISLLCTGRTGKSVIFQAWKEFYDITGHPERLRLTAPTGVVASDIGGCTIHSEASLRVSPAKMKSTPSLRINLEQRISPLETLILDEVYFLSAQDLGRLSEYLCMGRGDRLHMWRIELGHVW
jgi:hypothetical protein